MGEKFLIRDRAHRGDEALWWKPEMAGYTIDVDRAGRYEVKPMQFSDQLHEWVPEARALALAGRFVRVHDLLSTDELRAERTRAYLDGGER